MRKVSEIDKIIGGKIYNFRKKNNIKKKEICSFLTISIQQLDKYEKGINRVSVSTFITFLDKYDLNFDTFLNRKKHQNYDENQCLIRDMDKIKNIEIKSRILELIRNISRSKNVSSK